MPNRNVTAVAVNYEHTLQPYRAVTAVGVMYEHTLQPYRALTAVAVLVEIGEHITRPAKRGPGIQCS